MDRRSFLRLSGVVCAGALVDKVAAAEKLSSMAADTAGADAKFPLMDLHVHRSKDLTIEDIVAKSKQLNMKIGVMENISPWGIKDDAKLKEHIDSLRPYPVYIGLQPMSLGWSKNLSAEMIDQADYVAMDPQVVENGNGYGETVRVWEYGAYIDDENEFMERNMEHYMAILTGNEPLDVFACPLFLPCCIERDYHVLWTKKRLQQIVDAARSRDIAIEINDTVHVPHEDFIVMAKKAGLKFTFGSDARNHTVGRLDYCKKIARKCNLTEKDFFVPKRYR